MNKQQIIKFYNDSCEDSEFGWQASRWASEESQYERFAIAASFLLPNCSVLDVGCGTGDFYEFLKSRYKGIRYKGVDFSELMIEKAKQKYNSNFENADLSNIKEKFDYVFALGTFNLKSDEDQSLYFRNNIEKCFDLCEKRCVIFIKGDSSIAKYEDIHYYCPIEIMKSALSITPHVLISTSFLPYEITLCMYKTQH